MSQSVSHAVMPNDFLGIPSHQIHQTHFAKWTKIDSSTKIIHSIVTTDFWFRWNVATETHLLSHIVHSHKLKFKYENIIWESHPYVSVAAGCSNSPGTLYNVILFCDNWVRRHNSQVSSVIGRSLYAYITGVIEHLEEFKMLLHSAPSSSDMNTSSPCSDSMLTAVSNLTIYRYTSSY